MRVDLHCHSEASADCETPLRALAERAIERDLGVLAITDHDEIWGAQQLQAMVRDEPALHTLQVIVGEEVTTTQGEIIGLFLEEKIPKGVTPPEAVRQIRAQGGLVLLPHGFDRFKRGRLASSALEEIERSVDIVEAFNRRISFPRYNLEARAWATERNKPLSAGSDAHTLNEVGRAWLEVPERPVDTPGKLLDVLPGGAIGGRWRQPIVAYAQKLWARWTG